MTTTERRPSWAYKGTEVAGLSIADALVTAGIDYKVEAVPAFAAIPDVEGNFDIRPIRDAQHTFRTDTGEVLAQVGGRYHVVQTVEVTNLIEELVGGGWSPQFAGPVRQGRAVFMVGSLPFESAHGIDPYLAFVNSFDGTTGIRLANTPIRAMCTNAIRRTFARARSSFSLRHTVNVSSRVEEARHALALAGEYYRRLDNDIDRLLKVGIDEKRVDDALKMLFPIDATMTDRQRDNRERQRIDVTTHLNTSTTILDKDRGTAWGLWNAVSEMEQWHTEPTDKNREMLLGAQLGVTAATMKSDRLFRQIDAWAKQDGLVLA
jgi:phage/plasmid-like protein (TIGR03299 family)